MVKREGFSVVSILSLLALLVYLIYQAVGAKLDLQKGHSPFPTPLINAQALGEATPSASLTRARVIKVVDGDTLEVSVNGDYFKVRLIGINTPETVDPRRKVECFGKYASDQTKMLAAGKEVFLEKDVSQADKYNRLLRYVYIPIGGGKVIFLNDYLVRTGFAQVSTYPPDVKYEERFKAAEAQARGSSLGLWAECPGK